MSIASFIVESRESDKKLDCYCQACGDGAVGGDWKISFGMGIYILVFGFRYERVKLFGLLQLQRKAAEYHFCKFVLLSKSACGEYVRVHSRHCLSQPIVARN